MVIIIAVLVFAFNKRLRRRVYSVTNFLHRNGIDKYSISAALVRPKKDVVRSGIWNSATVASWPGLATSSSHLTQGSRVLENTRIRKLGIGRGGDFGYEAGSQV